ncbi:hypothetical protein TNCT_136401 [Trichonephila clavata]|uniref:Uncharacterized protein n=1 Tax=Trichonephila clavata TaxID=2740835 RepID=A0A8X6GL90_TRICU|nr:hypothetical protein TNCT_136401 [Trichonephila clavata]
MKRRNFPFGKEFCTRKLPPQKSWLLNSLQFGCCTGNRRRNTAVGRAKDLFRILSGLSFQNRSAVPLTWRHRSRDSDGSHIAFDG